MAALRGGHPGFLGSQFTACSPGWPVKPTAVRFPILFQFGWLGWTRTFPPTGFPDKCAPLRTQIRDTYLSHAGKGPRSVSLAALSDPVRGSIVGKWILSRTAVARGRPSRATNTSLNTRPLVDRVKPTAVRLNIGERNTMQPICRNSVTPAKAGMTLRVRGSRT